MNTKRNIRKEISLQLKGKLQLFSGTFKVCILILYGVGAFRLQNIRHYLFLLSESENIVCVFYLTSKSCFKTVFNVTGMPD